MALSAAFNLANLAAAGANYNTSNASAFANAQLLTDPFPYYFPRINATPAELFVMPPCKGVKIEEATIDELQSHLSNGSLTSVELVTCYIQREFQTGQYIQ